ncbi:nucleotide-binding protein [Agromyces bracchium]|uniref:Regulator n=1 Tax=Agromyces bracchium TaxID=88376 RepID=A0A6I3M5V9_9MICO|nr:regulator [Agromyces bracchium]MTH68859.1 regulator [Agromyces bracchium]
MARLALALDPSVEDRFLADLVEAGHVIVARVVGRRDVLDCLDVLGPDAVVVGAGAATLDAELLAACDRRGIRVVALASTDRDRAEASRIGLHEVLDAEVEPAELEAVLSGGPNLPSRLVDATGPLESSHRADLPGVIAVWGPSGAPGRTTTAVGIASELAAAGHLVALVDADPYGGAIAPALGLLDEAPGFASACRLAGSGALDRVELERIAQRYSSPRASFDVFTGLVGPSRWPELSQERVTETLRVMRARFEFVVIDVGFSLERDEELTSDPFAPRRNAATFAVLSAADRVVAVGLADPVGLSRLLRGHAELVEHVDPDRIDVLVNRVRTSALGIDAHAQVRQTLRRFAGLADAVLLPHDGRATDAAILTARTLRDAAPRSPLRAALRSYVDDRLLASAAEPRRGRVPFGALRRRAIAV